MQIECKCGERLQVPDDPSGHRLKCPRCGRRLPAPGHSPPPLPIRKSPADLAIAGDDAPPPEETHPGGDASPRRPPRLPGLTAPRKLQVTAGQMGAGIVLIGLVGAIPAATPLLDWARVGTPLPAWALILVLLAILQSAYACYLVQLPDWSSICVVTGVILLTCAWYATMLGLRLLVSDAHPLIQFFQLDVNDYRRGQEAGWLFIMWMLTGLLSYFAGRVALFWNAEFRKQT